MYVHAARAGACSGLAVTAAALSRRRQQQHPVFCETKKDEQVDKPSRQRIFFWGARSSLPHCPKNPKVPSEATFFVNHPKRWKQVRFGPSFGVARDEAGDLYAWTHVTKSEEKQDPQKVSCAQGPFVDVQCSQDKIYALGKDGRPWEISFDSETKTTLTARVMDEIPFGNGWFSSAKRIKKMSVGRQHVGFLLNNGKAYFVGNNAYGQCGGSSHSTPLALKIKNIYCGGTHSVVIDDEGQPQSFGNDKSIQLGLGDTRGMSQEDNRRAQLYQPDQEQKEMKLPNLKRNVVYKHYDLHQQAEPVVCMPCPAGPNRDPFPIEPTNVALGENFTIFAHKDSPEEWEGGDTHVLFSCGENQFGQCGRSLQYHHQTWNKVRTPKYQPIDDVTCGTSHCLALIRGEVWGWGRNNLGQAIPRPRSAHSQPCPEVLEISGRVVGISADYDASCVIVDDGGEKPELELELEAPFPTAGSLPVAQNPGFINLHTVQPGDIETLVANAPDVPIPETTDIPTEFKGSSSSSRSREEPDSGEQTTRKTEETK